MSTLAPCEFDHLVFDGDLTRVGAFRCHPSHPSFHDSGPARNFCFVFPRTAVKIHHEHEPAFVANPNVVTFYNRGQPYLRSSISTEGDRCDWFGVDIDVVRDVVRTHDPSVDQRPEAPFRFTRGWSDAYTYLLQRRVFEHLVKGETTDALAIEESILTLFGSVIQSAYRMPPVAARSFGSKQVETVRHVEFLLSTRLDECMTLRNIAKEVAISAYHLCRVFHRATGSTLHEYRERLRLRQSLENLLESDRPLVDIALDAGFSSHSHFTSTFRREFSQTPSKVRAQRGLPDKAQYRDSGSDGNSPII
jgi:AraC family transcriptional regulator